MRSSRIQGTRDNGKAGSSDGRRGPSFESDSLAGDSLTERERKRIQLLQSENIELRGELKLLQKFVRYITSKFNDQVEKLTYLSNIDIKEELKKSVDENSFYKKMNAKRDNLHNLSSQVLSEKEMLIDQLQNDNTRMRGLLGIGSYDTIPDDDMLNECQSEEPYRSFIEPIKDEVINRRKDKFYSRLKSDTFSISRSISLENCRRAKSFQVKSKDLKEYFEDVKFEFIRDFCWSDSYGNIIAPSYHGAADFYEYMLKKKSLQEIDEESERENHSTESSHQTDLEDATDTEGDSSSIRIFEMLQENDENILGPKRGHSESLIKINKTLDDLSSTIKSYGIHENKLPRTYYKDDSKEFSENVFQYEFSHQTISKLCFDWYKNLPESHSDSASKWKIKGMPTNFGKDALSKDARKMLKQLDKTISLLSNIDASVITIGGTESTITFPPKIEKLVKEGLDSGKIEITEQNEYSCEITDINDFPYFQAGKSQGSQLSREESNKKKRRTQDTYCVRNRLLAPSTSYLRHKNRKGTSRSSEMCHIKSEVYKNKPETDTVRKYKYFLDSLMNLSQETKSPKVPNHLTEDELAKHYVDGVSEKKFHKDLQKQIKIIRHCVKHYSEEKLVKIGKPSKESTESQPDVMATPIEDCTPDKYKTCGKDVAETCGKIHVRPRKQNVPSVDSENQTALGSVKNKSRPHEEIIPTESGSGTSTQSKTHSIKSQLNSNAIKESNVKLKRRSSSSVTTKQEKAQIRTEEDSSKYAVIQNKNESIDKELSKTNRVISKDSKIIDRENSNVSALTIKEETTDNAIKRNGKGKSFTRLVKQNNEAEGHKFKDINKFELLDKLVKEIDKVGAKHKEVKPNDKKETDRIGIIDSVQTIYQPFKQINKEKPKDNETKQFDSKGTQVNDQIVKNDMEGNIQIERAENPGEMNEVEESEKNNFIRNHIISRTLDEIIEEVTDPTTGPSLQSVMIARSLVSDITNMTYSYLSKHTVTTRHSSAIARDEPVELFIKNLVYEKLLRNLPIPKNGPIGNFIEKITRHQPLCVQYAHTQELSSSSDEEVQVMPDRFRLAGNKEKGVVDKIKEKECENKDKEKM